jgi:chemotaxis protein MotB
MSEEEFEEHPPKKEEQDEVEEGAPLWTVTFGDMMSLLLCFFVLLLSFSTLDVIKFKAIAESLSEAFGAEKQIIGEGSPISSPVDPEVQEDKSEEVVKEIQTAIDSQQLKNLAQVSRDSRGILIRVTGKVMFESGKAEIRNEAVPLLNELTSVMRRASQGIIVEGHTDTIPIHNERFPSNWELSSARAGSVVRHCIETGKLNPNMFRAVGYAATKPIASNQTADGREKNRRVEFVLIDQKGTKELDLNDPRENPLEAAGSDTSAASQEN